MQRTISHSVTLLALRRPRAGRLQRLRESRRRQESVARRIQDRLAFAAHHAAQRRAAPAAARRAAAAGSDAGRPGQGGAVAGPGRPRAARAAVPAPHRPWPGSARSSRWSPRPARAASIPTSAARSTPTPRRWPSSDKYLHRRPDLLAGHAAAGRGGRSGQGAAAAARRAGRRPAGVGGHADDHAPQARPARRHLLSSVPLTAPPRPARRPRRGRGLLRRPASALAKLFAVGAPTAETFTLANGLQVIVLPSRRAPIVTQVAGLQGRQRRRDLRPYRRRAFPRAHDVQGHRQGARRRVLAHRLAQRRPRQRLHDLRLRPATTRPSRPTGSSW